MGRPIAMCYAGVVKTISVSISEDDYEAFRTASRKQKRPIAQLIREAMAHYRKELLEARPRLTDLPRLVGHRPVTALPSRSEIYDEIVSRDERPGA